LAVRGLSVTAPFKLDALARAVSADPLARRLGAANTLTKTPDGWVARNTDVEGFLHPLRPRLTLAGARAAVLGAGGAARAVVAGLDAEGARVTVHARRADRAEALVPLGAAVGAWPPPPGSWDLLVNTTPVGTSPDVDETPVAAAWLAGGGLVYDLVYNPGRTRLLRDAAAAGCGTLGGLEMLIAQAAVQVATWFPVDPPVDAMRAAIHAEAPQLALETPCPR
jgi:shikimate dehydrogenase